MDLKLVDWAVEESYSYLHYINVNKLQPKIHLEKNNKCYANLIKNLYLFTLMYIL